MRGTPISTGLAMASLLWARAAQQLAMARDTASEPVAVKADRVGETAAKNPAVPAKARKASPKRRPKTALAASAKRRRRTAEAASHDTFPPLVGPSRGRIANWLKAWRRFRSRVVEDVWRWALRARFAYKKWAAGDTEGTGEAA